VDDLGPSKVTAVKISEVKVGDKVTCKQEEAAYYSGYAGNPVVIFKPGMVGIVGSVKVPYVRTSRGQNSYFVCVDFKVAGVFQGNPKCGNDTWRVPLDYVNIVNIVKTRKRGGRQSKGASENDIDARCVEG